jgi:hypothetical protein
MTKSATIPKGWEDLYAALTSLTDRFCEEHLDQEYADLARCAIAALCCKRPSPLTNGNPQTWAYAVPYALGQINFLSGKSAKPYWQWLICAIILVSPQAPVATRQSWSERR